MEKHAKRTAHDSPFTIPDSRLYLNCKGREGTQRQKTKTIEKQAECTERNASKTRRD